MGREEGGASRTDGGTNGDRRGTAEALSPVPPTAARSQPFISSMRALPESFERNRRYPAPRVKGSWAPRTLMQCAGLIGVRSRDQTVWIEATWVRTQVSSSNHVQYVTPHPLKTLHTELAQKRSGDRATPLRSPVSPIVSSQIFSRNPQIRILIAISSRKRRVLPFFGA